MADDSSSNSKTDRLAISTRILRILQVFDTLLGIVLMGIALADPGGHLSQPKIYVLLGLGMMVALIGYITMEMAVKTIQKISA